MIELDATAELAGLTGRLGALAARAVKRGVDANLASLKRLLEEPDTASRLPSEATSSSS